VSRRSSWRFPSTTSGIGALLVCLALAALCFSATAGAYSRGFRLKNDSDRTLTLIGVSKVPARLCNHDRCVNTHHPMSFEGRPKDGSTLRPGGVDGWELSYLPGETYGAILKYEIGDHLGIVEYTIETKTFSNDSSCKVTPGAGKCSAGGLQLGFGR
jgi:hypothetical protein